jgi:cell wall-associated NlpC family hydrolase
MIFSTELFKLYALQFVGINYLWGGDDPLRGYDCSGFAQELLRAFGGHPKSESDLTAQGLYDILLTKEGQYNNSAVGALAFYGKDFRRIIHVAAVIGNNLVIEAGGGGSATTSLDAAISQNAFVRIRPMKYRADFITTVLPKYI